jgi:hypothetical protein
VGVYKQASEFVVRVADLAEAEGRLLRRVVGRVGLGVALTAVAAGLLFIGVVGVLGGVWLALREPLGPAWASVVVGVLFIAGAGGLFALGARYSR